jgi:putative FmdB family regulatory protein
MALHAFECEVCGERFERIMHFKELYDPDCPICGGKTEQVFTKGNGGFSFKFTPGKPTGVYALDYGKNATWDCTVPGKMEYLKKEGRISDPFESK